MLNKTLIALAMGGLLASGAAIAQNPYEKPDDSWITLSGTVQSTSADGFKLDYGDGIVTVEMDAPDGDASGYRVVKGDKVTVSGVVDDDLFETASIEASSVFVEGLNTHFFASSAIDEEDLLVAVPTPVVVSRTMAVGTVTEVDGREFTLDTGARRFTIDTSRLGANLTDDQGFMQIEVGDRVSVVGSMDRDFFEGRELMADSVVSLSTVSDGKGNLAAQ